MKEETIIFRLGSNLLQVIYHFPNKENDKNIGILFCDAGLAYNIGVGRLYVIMARALADCGFHVFRFDPQGVGDSDGPQLPTHFDMHNPSDVLPVVQYAKNELKASTIVLHGLCSGGRAAIKGALMSADVDGVVVWSMPIVTPGLGATKVSEETEHGVTDAVAKYWMERLGLVFRKGKFLKPRFWKNILH